MDTNNAPVYQQLTQNKTRKCRSETILRLLLSTSYPQSTLTDLTLALSVHGGQTDLVELEHNAIDLREIEKDYTLFDFVRVVEIKRVLGEIKVKTSCLDLDPAMRVVIDNTNTHQQMAVSTINLVKPSDALSDVDALSVRLLELFYRSQVKVRRHNDSIAQTTWCYRVKEIDRSQPNKSMRIVETNLDIKQAIHRLGISLRKKSFHVILTQNAILLLDQKARLYGVIK